MDTKDSKRFYSKINRLGPDDCWAWAAGMDKDGYGLFWLNGKTVRAHRIAYSNHFGEFDKKLCVLHRKDNSSCCNPKHLFLGTKVSDAGM